MKRLNAYYNSERFLLRFLMIDSCVFVLAFTFWLTHS